MENHSFFLMLAALYVLAALILLWAIARARGPVDPQEGSASATDSTAPAPGAPRTHSSSETAPSTPPVPSKVSPFTDFGVKPINNQAMRIKKCSDPQMWYKDHVGMVFAYEGEYYEPMRDRRYYWTREPSGSRNIVHFDDVEILGKGAIE